MPQRRKSPRPLLKKHAADGQRPKSASGHGAQGELRIIGGDWRSRKLTFPDSGGVRPTPARARETLFNWLRFHLAGAHCLDLFAGSGALGLEALSRGAAHSVFVDHTPELVKALNNNLALLRANNARVVRQDTDAFLASPGGSFDIVFIDPPFRQGWLARLLPALADNGWVKPGSWVYLEHESELTTPAVPAGWQLQRQKSAGQVCYCLFRITDTTPV
jgi:16S rRNA (guanine966-N2)-methyltransferase